MGNRSFAVQHQERHREDDHFVTPVAPCNLLQEVHDDNYKWQSTQRPGQASIRSDWHSHDRFQVAGAISVVDARENTIQFDNCYATTVGVGACHRPVNVIEHDQHRERKQHTKVLFGLFSGDHEESRDTRGYSLNGEVMGSTVENSEDRIKFLGITIAEAHHHGHSNSPRYLAPSSRHHGKW